MKKIYFLIPIIFLIISCGHNVLTDYEVVGIDLSVPIFGYPFGVRIGGVKVNSNMVRGNSTYTSHSNVGTEIASGTAQKTNIIQFSSNTQINEGNVEAILTNEKVPETVKHTFVKDYLADKSAPSVLPVSSKTPTTTTASGDNSKIHTQELHQSDNIISFNEQSIVSSVVAAVGAYFLNSSSGKIISLLIKIIAGIIITLFLKDIIKKLITYFKNKKKNN